MICPVGAGHNPPFLEPRSSEDALEIPAGSPGCSRLRRVPSSPIRRLAFACAPLFLSLLLTACGTGDDSGPRGAPPVAGNPAPDWEGRSLEGEMVRLDDLRGQIVVLNVWATWCAPCVREMPALEALHREYGPRGVTVIGASVDRGSARGAVRSFVEDHDISFLILLDPDQSIMSRFRTLGVPETFLIGPDGVIAHRWIGEFDPMKPSETERVERLLDEMAH